MGDVKIRQNVFIKFIYHSKDLIDLNLEMFPFDRNDFSIVR